MNNNRQPNVEENYNKKGTNNQREKGQSVIRKKEV